MNKYYTIQLTSESTSPGPYTIYWNSPNSAPNIPTIYPTTQLAQNLELNFLQTGITISVPDTTNIIYIYNLTSLCTFITLTPPLPPITYNNFCLLFENSRFNTSSQYQFDFDSIVSGYPTWSTSNGNVISWNGSNWISSGTYFNNLSISSTNTNSSSNPPYTDWTINGNPSSNLLTSQNNNCLLGRLSSFQVSVNQPTCLCDGSIIFNVNLDNPPFSYSIDNGVTYSSSPIFTNLCSGIYILSAVDNLGETFSKTITLDTPTVSTTYYLSLNTSKTTPVLNQTSTVNSYKTIVNVTPPLPDGTTITFDLIHTNSFYSSPTSGTSVLNTGTILDKNSTTILVTDTVTGNSISVNTTPGCQSNFIYQSDINEVWNGLTLTNSDTITISTTSRVDKTLLNTCVVGYSNDIYSISNVVISGCDCCSINAAQNGTRTFAVPYESPSTLY